MKLFEDHSPTMGEVEGFSDHIPSGIVEALTVFPTWDTRSSGFNPARSQLPNLKHLGLVGASLEGIWKGRLFRCIIYISSRIIEMRGRGPELEG